MSAASLTLPRAQTGQPIDHRTRKLRMIMLSDGAERYLAQWSHREGGHSDATIAGNLAARGPAPAELFRKELTNRVRSSQSVSS